MANNNNNNKTAVAGKKRKSSSSSFHSKKKSQQQQQQQQQQPRKRKHADLVTDGKRIWNQLRQKNVSTTERRTLLDELVPLVLTNKAKEIALQHDGSRLVQAVIQFGNETERTTLVDLLVQEETAVVTAADGGDVIAPLHKKSSATNTIVALCQSQYAHFLVLKILKYCTVACHAKVLAALQGHMPHLAVHATASRVVEAIWQQQANTTTTSHRLWQELYGPHCSLFAQPNPTTQQQRPTLASNIQAHPTKRDVTLTFVRTWIDKAIAKQQLFGYSFFHTFLLEFCEHCQSQSPAELRVLAATPLADATLHLLSTPQGTHVVCLLAAYATAKDRKRMVKSCKGYAASALLSTSSTTTHSYLAILRLVQVTDDTVSIYKNVLAELVGSSDKLLEIALSPTASKLLRWLLLAPEKQDDDTDAAAAKLFDPAEQVILASSTDPPTIVDDAGVQVPTSKKDHTTRRRELMVYLEKPLLEVMCTRTTTSNHSGSTTVLQQLVTSIPGSYIVLGMYRRCPEQLVPALMEICDGAGWSSSSDGTADAKSGSSCTSIWDHPIGHRTLKLLLLSVDTTLHTSTTTSTTTTPLLLSTALVQRYAPEHFAPCLTSHRGAFVVNALCSVDRDAVVAALLPHPPSGGGGAGYEALAKTIHNKTTTTKKNVKKQ